MSMQTFRFRAFAWAAGLAILAFSGWVSADPPSRVARLGYLSGPVSFSPAGENEWVQARLNRPLTTGDRLWVDAGGRAELQLGGAMVRMNANTDVSVLNLDDRVAQLQITQGILNVRLRRLGRNQVFEVDTPNLAFVLRQPGAYRIEVDPERNATTIVVRQGRGEVYGDGAAYVIDSRQPYRFTGTGLREYRYVDAPRLDEFDRWSSDRDRRGAVSARYVSPEVIGYEDLDNYGRWRVAEGYGNVWEPTRVAAGWVPYRDGHWSWVEPWGWTWVDDAPWGFAVSHYGRWANIGGTWGWIPGPVRAQAVYAPALVAFIIGSALQVAMSGGDRSGVAWFPLGPRDVYRPSYPVSRRYFSDVNTSNAKLNTTNITNVYNNVSNVTYVNQRVPGAIVAVPSTTFVQSQPVGRSAVRVSREALATAAVTAVAAVAPVQASVRGAAAPGSRPSSEAQTRPVVARTRPAPALVPFAARQPALAANPGQPLDAAALAAVKPTVPAPAPTVNVVSPSQRVVPPPKPQAVAPQESQPVDEKKGRRAREVQPAPPPPASVPKSPEAQAPAPPVIVPKPPAVQTPVPPVSAPKPPEAQKAPSPQEAQKGAQRFDDRKGRRAREEQPAPPPPVSVPKPPAAQVPAPPVSAPKPPAAQAPVPPVIAPKPPEAQKAPPPQEAQKGPQPFDDRKGRRAREEQPAPPPPVSVPKPPTAQVPAPAVSAPKPPAAQAPVPPVSVPKPPAPEAQKASPPQPEAAKSAEQRSETKGDGKAKREARLKCDATLNPEDKLKCENRLKLEEKLRLEEKLKR